MNCKKSQNKRNQAISPLVCYYDRTSGMVHVSFIHISIFPICKPFSRVYSKMKLLVIFLMIMTYYDILKMISFVQCSQFKNSFYYVSWDPPVCFPFPPNETRILINRLIELESGNTLMIFLSLLPFTSCIQILHCWDEKWPYGTCEFKFASSEVTVPQVKYTSKEYSIKRKFIKWSWCCFCLDFISCLF